MTKNVNIADIVFSYNNRDLILALRDRGSNIALQKFDKVQEKDAEINELFKDFESLTRPTAAFITFEEEDACILALKLQTDETLNMAPKILHISCHGGEKKALSTGQCAEKFLLFENARGLGDYVG